MRHEMANGECTAETVLPRAFETELPSAYCLFECLDEGNMSRELRLNGRQLAVRSQAKSIVPLITHR